MIPKVGLIPAVPQHVYFTWVMQASSLDISQRGLLGIGFGSHVHVWKDALAHKVGVPNKALSYQAVCR